MTVKQSVLQKLEANRDKTLSGQDLARELNVSRTAVWKAVQALREEGYPISAGQNRGYCLSNRSDILSGEGIRAFLRPELSRLAIYSYDAVDSTNEEAKRLAPNHPGEPFLVVSNQQYRGKTRNPGQTFLSPANAGIYLSLYQPYSAPFCQMNEILNRAAIAVRQVIASLTEEVPEIRDHTLYLREHKISGILTEANLLLEPGEITSLITGIGVYTAPCDSGQNHMISLSALKTKPFCRPQLIGEIINLLL